jgi:RNA polymerase sigma-70 factor (ECF subfamily)
VNPADASYWTDHELLEKYRDSYNNEWLGILLERYLHLVLGVCMKYLRNEEEARDGAQQICLKVIKILPRHEVTYFKSWLYQVAKNHCLMKLRQSHQIHILPLSDQQWEEQLEHSSEEAGLLEQESTYRYLRQAMDLLNEAQRRCLEKFYLEKLTYQKVAEVTGYTLMQVKSHIQNGRRNLRRIMERLVSEGAGDAGPDHSKKTHD